jgi:hypothetical protein
MKNRIIQTILFLTFVTQFSFAQNNLEFVSKLFANGPEDVVLDSNYLYVTNGGMAIFDFSNPVKPILLKQLTQMEGMNANNELIINGDTGYATWGGGGIMILDFSNPLSPSTLGLLNSSYDYHNLVLKFPYMFAIAESQIDSLYYLQSINIKNGKILDSMSLLNGFPHSAYEAKRFIVDNNFLYLTMGDRGQLTVSELHIFDISTPDNISFKNYVDLGACSAIPIVLQGSHWDLAKKNNYIYVAARFLNPKCHVKIVDVSNPFSPKVVKEWADPAITGFSGDIEISGDNLFLTDFKSSFNVISITNDTTLSLCKRISNGLAPAIDYNTNFNIQLVGNYAFLSGVDHYAAYTIDVSLPCNAMLIDTIPFAHDWEDIAARDTDFIFTSVWNFYQLYSLDARDELNPIISKRTEVKGSGWGIDVKNNFAYLAMGIQGSNYPPTTKSGGLIVYDISNPDRPLEKGWSPPIPPNNEVQVYVNPLSNLAYIIAGQHNEEGESYMNHISLNPGLRIVDVSNPDFLNQLGEIHITPQCRGIFQEGKYAYIAASSPDSSTVIDTSGIYIIDVSNSANPYIAGKWVRTQLHGGHTRAVTVKGNYAYIAHSDSLVVLNVSNHTSPFRVKGIALGHFPTMDVAVSGDFLFVLTQNSLFVFDISIPTDPIKVDEITGIFLGAAKHFDIEPPYIYVLCSGVFIFKFQGFTQTGVKGKEVKTEFIIYPNPFNKSAILEIKNHISRKYELKLYDLFGREVRKCEIKNQKTEISRGDLPEGIYLYQVKDNNQIIASGKLIIQ